MPRFALLLLVVLATLSLATGLAFERTSRFEDLGDAPSVGDGIPFSSDGEIIYNGFTVVGSTSQDVPLVAGVRPHSRPHNILAQRSATGSFATTDRCVALKELWVGCTNVNVDPKANVPLACLVTLTSFNNVERQTGVQKVTYLPDNDVLAHMIKVSVTLPPARVIRIVATALPNGSPDDAGTLVTGLNVDDVTYIQYRNDAEGNVRCVQAIVH